jgi:hypothetical protein
VLSAWGAFAELLQPACCTGLFQATSWYRGPLRRASKADTMSETRRGCMQAVAQQACLRAVLPPGFCLWARRFPWDPLGCVQAVAQQACLRAILSPTSTCGAKIPMEPPGLHAGGGPAGLSEGAASAAAGLPFGGLVPPEWPQLRPRAPPARQAQHTISAGMLCGRQLVHSPSGPTPAGTVLVMRSMPKHCSGTCYSATGMFLHNKPTPLAT